MFYPVFARTWAVLYIGIMLKKAGIVPAMVAASPLGEKFWKDLLLLAWPSPEGIRPVNDMGPYVSTVKEVPAKQLPGFLSGLLPLHHLH